MKLFEIRKEAREALRGKWGKGVSIVLAYLVIAFIIGFITGIFEENSIISFVLAIVELIVSVPLSFGLAFAFLKLKRNEDVGAFEFIEMGISNFSKSWRIAGRTILKLVLPIIAIIGALLAYIGLVVYSAMQLTLGGVESVGSIMIIGVVIYILAIVYYVSVSLLYSLTSFIAYDNKEMTASEIVNESAKLMKGNRCKFVLLELSFLGWAILTVFTLGIGYLWLLPYMYVAKVCFYEYLLGKNETNEPEENFGPIKEM